MLLRLLLNTPDVTGEYVLSLQVNDGVTVSNIDYVIVSIVTGGTAPVADCGGSYEERLVLLLL